MKGMKKNDMGVSPVIAVILMVAITVVLAGVLYLWVSSLADTDEQMDNLNVKASADLSDALLTIDVQSGTLTWDEYKVTFNGTTVATLSTETSAGEVATFDISVGSPTHLVSDEVSVKIINIEDNKIVWQKDITIKA